MTQPSYPYLRHSRNTTGRDFVVGDLHGCRTALGRGLNAIGFDPAKDRLFSTGDLVDRGAEPLECLMLLDEPWFHAVIANHDRMLLARMGRPERIRTRLQAMIYSEHWNDRLSADELRTLDRLLLRVAALPAVMEVESAEDTFFVLHAERPKSAGRAWSDEQLRQGPFSGSALEALTWGRKAFKAMPGLGKANGHNGIAKIEGAVAGTTTYVGHSIVVAPVLFGSNLFIDGGAYRAHRGEAGGLCIVEHVPRHGPTLRYHG